MSIDGIPSRTSLGYQNYDIMFSGYSDMIIFIEDGLGVSIYESIFARLFGAAAQTMRIQPLHGKRNVEAHYKATKNVRDVNAPVIPSVYICDMDYDNILNQENMVEAQDFIYLDRYSIENYLVDERVGVHFLNGRTQLGKRECKRKLDIQGWQACVQKNYKRIVFTYLLSQGLGLENFPNTSLSVKRFLSDRSPWRWDESKERRYIKQFTASYKASGKTGLLSALRKVIEIIQRTYNGNIYHLIPGKQLLEYFCLHLSNLAGDRACVPNEQDFISSAVLVCDIHPLQFLKDRIQSLFNTPTSLEDSV